ncbi:asparagine synthase (glutamine-hydrolyzing) [Magnetococcales bacterium HHB-1]
MCGLIGHVCFSHHRLSSEQRDHLRQARDTLAHRGPDAAGEWWNEQVYMGHRRLSILDLSSAGTQPLSDEDYILTFNGEIYNYLELRQELKTLGYHFKTNTDTEVMLKALQLWKEAALPRFDGMFAAALHDKKADRHLLMRDPLGQKPLYYTLNEQGLTYASEPRALLNLPDYTWHLDHAAFHRYLLNGYYARHETPLEEMKKLLPGHILIYDRKKNDVVIEQYWDSIPGKDPLDIKEEEALDQFEALFQDACTIAQRADVPSGVFLSGGVDSTLIAATCRQLNPELQTFCVAMGEKDFDESAKADLVNQHLNIAHAHTFTMDDREIQRSMHDFFLTLDEPHGDPGFVNAFFLARSAKSAITVALSGDGGDELFAGYAPFLGLTPEKLIRYFPASLWPLLKKLIPVLIPANDRYLGLQFKMLAYSQGFPASPQHRFPLWLASIPLTELGKLVPDIPHTSLSSSDIQGAFGEMETLLAPLNDSSRLQQLAYYYQKSFLPDFVCQHTDRASMQFALETRSPFLSPKLIEFANRLPDHLKLRGNTLKYLLRQSCRRRGLPESIYHQKKQGFTFPLARWLKTHLRETMIQALAPEQWPEGLVDRDYIQHLKQQHLSGTRNNYRILYNLIVFQKWYQRYGDRIAIG